VGLGAKRTRTLDIEKTLSVGEGLSKKNGVNPVKASPDLPLDPVDFTRQFAQVAKTAGLRQECYGAINGHPLIAYTKRTAGPRPRVYLSAGMHGDEPAPPGVLLELLRGGFFDERCQWTICPLLNPTGFLMQTRENYAGVDLNRDYKEPRTSEIQAHVRWLQRQPVFDLIICLHEDWEAQGFYLYELNPDARHSLAPAMIAAANRLGPIESATVIDGREADESGIIRPVSDPLLRETWPEAIYLRNFHGTLDYTIETASSQPLPQRLATQVAVVQAAVTTLMQCN